MPALGKERLHSLTGKREKELCLRVRHLCDSLRGIMSSDDVERERERESESAFECESVRLSCYYRSVHVNAPLASRPHTHTRSLSFSLSS